MILSNLIKYDKGKSSSNGISSKLKNEAAERVGNFFHEFGHDPVL